MTAVALFLLRMLGRLPLRPRRFVGARLGDLARFVLPARRRVAARNLLLAFPEFSVAARAAILRRHFQLLGTVFVDECALLNMSADEVHEWVRLDDEEALQDGAIIFCAPHFITASISGVRLSVPLGGRMMFHYRPLHSKFWNNFYQNLRQQFGGTGVAATAASAMRSCALQLRRGSTVFYLPDTDMGRRKSTIFAPFLGVDAASTTTVVPRLAMLAKAEVRMFSTFMTDDGYAVRCSPPLADFPGTDTAAAARRINELIGAEVRRDPAQYYWLHRRFKTHPEGEESRYA